MRQIVVEALDAGALGFATSKSPTHVGFKGKPVPSRVASLGELESLASTLEHRDAVMQVTAGKGFWFDEYEDLTRKYGMTISWTAMLAGMASPDAHIAQQQRSRELAEQGLPIVPQVTPRPLCFEFQFKEPFPFEALPVFKPISSADFDGKKALYADAEFRTAAKEKMDNVRPSFRLAWENSLISSCPSQPEYEERTVIDVATELGVHTMDLGFDLALENELEARFRMPVANADEDEVEKLITDKNTVIGLSDAGAHASQLCDAGLPTYLLGHWVREKQVIAFEEAIRMLSSRPAEVFGISDRGFLKVGRPADVLVVDPETVHCGKLDRVYDQPAGQDRLIAEAFGIESVIVNGTLLRQQGEDQVDPKGDLPGQLLRGGKAS